jgi:hypothetical protein
LRSFEPARTLLTDRIDEELPGTVWGSTTVKTRLVMADLAADELLTALEDRRRRPCLIRRPTFGRPAYAVTTEDHAGEPDGRGGQQVGRDQADGSARVGTGPFGTKILARSRRADRRRRGRLGLAGGGGASQTGWRRRGRGQGGAVVVFGIKPSPPSAARVVASSV